MLRHDLSCLIALVCIYCRICAVGNASTIRAAIGWRESEEKRHIALYTVLDVRSFNHDFYGKDIEILSKYNGSISFDEFQMNCSNESIMSVYCNISSMASNAKDSCNRTDHRQRQSSYDNYADSMASEEGECRADVTRVLVIVNAYHSRENEYLLRTIETYHRDFCINNETKRDIRIIIQTTDIWTIDEYVYVFSKYKHCPIRSNTHSFSIDIDVYHPDIRNHLSEYHRHRVSQLLDHYDLFIYQEDDMAINVTHIDMFVNYTYLLRAAVKVDDSIPSSNKLDNKNSMNSYEQPEALHYIIGFTRYEHLNEESSFRCDNCDFTIDHGADNSFLIESPMEYPIQAEGKLQCIEGTLYIIDDFNPHQAFWMLTKEQITRLDSQCNFLQQSAQGLIFPAYIREYMSSLSVRFENS